MQQTLESHNRGSKIVVSSGRRLNATSFLSKVKRLSNVYPQLSEKDWYAVRT